MSNGFIKITAEEKSLILNNFDWCGVSVTNGMQGIRIWDIIPEPSQIVEFEDAAYHADQSSSFPVDRYLIVSLQDKTYGSICTQDVSQKELNSDFSAQWIKKLYEVCGIKEPPPRLASRAIKESKKRNASLGTKKRGTKSIGKRDRG